MLQSQLFNVTVPAITKGDGTGLPPHEATVELHISKADIDKETGRVVIFLPYWGGSASTFESVISSLHLAQPTTTCLAISYSGTGNTPFPTHDDPELHAINARAEQLLGVLSSSKLAPILSRQRVVICAHSMSAKIAYVLLSKLAIVEPKFVLNVEAMVLLGPAPVGPLVLPDVLREQQLHAYDSLESARWTVENVLSHQVLLSETLDRLAHDCTGMSPGAKAGWLNYGMTFDCTEAIQLLRKQWPQLQIRLLVGDNDQVEAMERVKEQTLKPLTQLGFDVKLDVVSGCGHLLPVEAVEEIRVVIEDLLRR